MKVLLTATVQSHICQFHRPLVEVLHEHGCEVHVAAKNNLYEKNGIKLDFVDKVYDVPFARSPKSKNNVCAYKELKTIIELENYNVIHCNTPMGGIVTRLAAIKARKNGTKVYYTAHGFHFYKGAPKINWLIYYPIEKIFSCFTDKIITINREDYVLANKRFYSDVFYIHGVGVDEIRYISVPREQKQIMKQEMGYSSGQKIVLCIGELLPNKNQKMAITMMKKVRRKYPDAILLIAGNGPEKEKLEKFISVSGMQNSVQMLGYCTCLEKYQQIADVVVSCSKREGLPLNIVEAMLSSNPVVATKNRGHCELIQDGKTGYLVEVNDINSMAQYVQELLKYEEKNIKMGTKEREIAEKYGVENVKKELQEIYFN